MRRLFAIALLLIFSSCSSTERADYVIGVSQCSEDLWRETMNDEITREVSFYPGVDLVIRSVKDDTDGQIRDIEALIEQGVNLLDERASGTNWILEQNMKIIYDGTSYSLRKATRAEDPVLPVMNGFYLQGYYAEAKLIFGEFSIDTKEYRGETFTIDWGDGTTSEVKFDLYVTQNENEQPTYHFATWLDGKVNNETSLTVTVTAGAEGVGIPTADRR